MLKAITKVNLTLETYAKTKTNADNLKGLLLQFLNTYNHIIPNDNDRQILVEKISIFNPYEEHPTKSEQDVVTILIGHTINIVREYYNSPTVRYIMGDATDVALGYLRLVLHALDIACKSKFYEYIDKIENDIYITKEEVNIANKLIATLDTALSGTHLSGMERKAVTQMKKETEDKLIRLKDREEVAIILDNRFKLLEEFHRKPSNLVLNIINLNEKAKQYTLEMTNIVTVDTDLHNLPEKISEVFQHKQSELRTIQLNLIDKVSEYARNQIGEDAVISANYIVDLVDDITILSPDVATSTLFKRVDEWENKLKGSK